MPDNSTHGIRQLPIYETGFAAGRDVGLCIALDVLTAERVRQEQLDTRPDSRAYADGALLAVSKVLAGRFRRA